jgi:hypothetical protein
MGQSAAPDRRFKCRWQNRRGRMEFRVKVIIVFSKKGPFSTPHD